MKKILLLESDAALTESIELFLKYQKFCVCIANEYRLKCNISKFSPDVVLLGLPIRDNLINEMLSLVKKQNGKNIPLLILDDGNMMPSNLLKDFQSVKVLQKPFRLTDLLSNVIDLTEFNKQGKISDEN